MGVRVRGWEEDDMDEMDERVGGGWGDEMGTRE